MGTISEERTNFVVIVDLHVRAVSEFRGKKSNAICDLLAYFCTVLRFSDPLTPPHIRIEYSDWPKSS